MCCHTETEVADQTCYLTQSRHTDTSPTSHSVDPVTPGAWLGSRYKSSFKATGMTWAASRFDPSRLEVWLELPQGLTRAASRFDPSRLEVWLELPRGLTRAASRFDPSCFEVWPELPRGMTRAASRHNPSCLEVWPELPQGYDPSCLEVWIELPRCMTPAASRHDTSYLGGDPSCLEVWLELPQGMTRATSRFDSSCLKIWPELPRGLTRAASRYDSSCLEVWLELPEVWSELPKGLTRAAWRYDPSCLEVWLELPRGLTRVSIRSRDGCHTTQPPRRLWRARNNYGPRTSHSSSYSHLVLGFRGAAPGPPSVSLSQETKHTNQCCRWLLACLKSWKRVDESQGRVCCHTETEVADQAFYLTR